MAGRPNVEVGVAYLSLAASTERFSRDTDGALNVLEGNAGRTGKRSGSKLMSGIGNAFKTIGKIGGAALATVATGLSAIAIRGGFQRALAADQAEASLRSLGQTSEQAVATLDGVRETMRGTGFAFAQAAPYATKFAAMGIEGGEELNRVMAITADAAGAMGGDFSRLARYIGRVASTGYATAQDLYLMGYSGVQALSVLANHMGITEKAVSEMAAEGEISLEKLLSAMEATFAGGAAEHGRTFRGAMTEAREALGALGETAARPIMNMLGDIFARAVPAIDSFSAAVGPAITQLMDRLAPAVERVADSFFSWLENVDFTSLRVDLSWLGSLLGPLAGLSAGALAPLISKLPMIGPMFKGITGPAGLVVGLLATMLVQSPELREALRTLFEALVSVASEIAPIVQGLIEGLAPAIPIVTDLATRFIKWIAPLAENKELVKALVVAVLAIKAIKTVSNVWNSAMGLMRTSTKKATAAKGKLGKAMMLGGGKIGLVIKAVALLVAGLTWFFTQTEVGRRAWEAFTTWLARTWNDLVTVARFTWEQITSTITNLMERLRTSIANIKNGIVAVFSGIADAITAPFRAAFEGIRSLWNSTVGGFGFSVPSWIPGVGGRRFDIPRLANGGIAVGEQLAVVGDNRSGREAIVPLERVGEFADAIDRHRGDQDNYDPTHRDEPIDISDRSIDRLAAAIERRYRSAARVGDPVLI